LVWSTCGLAASGPGIGFKVGAQTLEDPVDLDDTTRFRAEVELSSPLFFDNHFDVALTLGGSSLGSFETEYADVVDDVTIAETYDDDLSIFDVRLAARFYPLGDASEIRPYVGAGVGYFWFFDQWEREYTEIYPVPELPGVYDVYTEEDEDTDTAAEGFFPFLAAGVAIPIGDQFELLLDFQYDFEKKDSGFDFGGPIYMIGGRFRF
jgi:outer membrane protein W